jgi:hypothetical protein
VTIPSNIPNNLKRMIVYIPARTEHEGLYGVYVVIDCTCPKCGAPRGEPYLGISYDGSRRLHVDTWQNPCGHVDKYDAVREEARKNGYNVEVPSLHVR